MQSQISDALIEMHTKKITNKKKFEICKEAKNHISRRVACVRFTMARLRPLTFSQYATLSLASAQALLHARLSYVVPPYVVGQRALQ